MMALTTVALHQRVIYSECYRSKFTASIRTATHKSYSFFRRFTASRPCLVAVCNFSIRLVHCNRFALLCCCKLILALFLLFFYFHLFNLTSNNFKITLCFYSMNPLFKIIHLLQRSATSANQFYSIHYILLFLRSK